MKKSILIVFFFSFIFCKDNKAQTYIPLVIDSSHWFLENKPYTPAPPPYDYIDYYLLGDTMVFSINYKKVYFRQEVTNSYKNMVSPYSLYALIREDTLARKVYALLLQNSRTSLCPLNQEILLYDFSVQIGDTLKQNDLCLQFYDEIVQNVIPINYSISTYSYLLQSGIYTLYQGIGSSFGLFEHIYASVSGPQHLLVDYCRGGLSNCPFLSLNISDKTIENDIKIYPNPTTGVININNSTNYNTINIYSLSGKLVKTQSASLQISVLDLPKGMYFIQLVGNKNNVVQKFIKE